MVTLQQEKYEQYLKETISDTTKEKLAPKSQQLYNYYYPKMIQDQKDFFNCSEDTLISRMKSLLTDKNSKYKTNIVARAAFIHMLRALDVPEKKIDTLPDVRIRRKSSLTDPKKMRQKRKFVEKTDLILAETTDERMNIALNILLQTGIRRNELINIKPENIKQLHGKEVLGAKIEVVIKGGDEIDVFISQQLYNHIQQYIGENKIKKDEFLIDFPEKTHKKDDDEYLTPLNDRRGQQFYYRFKKLMKEILASDGKKISPHSTRHAVGQMIIQSGGDIKEVKEMLHHRNIQTSEIYAIFDETMKMSISERLISGKKKGER